MCASLSELASEDLIIVDEKDLAEMLTQNANRLPTIVICSNSTRSQAASRQDIPAVTEFISKPFGPRKLAKAFRLCLDKARDYHLGLTPVVGFSGGGLGPLESKADEIPSMEHLTLETEDILHPLDVQTNGVVTAGESENAQMAIDHWTVDSANGTSGDVTVTDGANFPFPDQNQHQPPGPDTSETYPTSPRLPQNENAAPFDRPTGDLTRRDSRRPALISRQTEPAVKGPFPHSVDVSFHDSSAVTKYGEKATSRVEASLSDAAGTKALDGTASSTLTTSNMALHNNQALNETLKTQPQERELRPPKLLLVDDNKINLRLLETYMRKRKYELVDSAENGQLAVQAFESYEPGYDIIFMGKSSFLTPASIPSAHPNLTTPRPHNRHQHAHHERLRSHPRHPRH